MGRATTFMPCAFLLLAFVIFPLASAAYDVYWNVPTEVCQIRFNMSFDFIPKEFGIKMNDKGTFRGNEITILYNPGLFPEYKGYKYDSSLKVPDLSKLVIINGGLPQEGDMLKHLDAFEVSVNQSVPDTKNKGIIIIDMEHFGGTWAQNFVDMEIYRIMSRKRVQDKYPTYITAQVEAQAKLEYERAATNFLVKTLQYAKALRPYASWGYYIYPQCFNAVGVDRCPIGAEEENNQMILTWKKSDAMFPSAYLPNEGTADDKAKRTAGKVREAKRLFNLASKPEGKVYPYISYKYYHMDSFIQDIDLENLIAVPKKEGASGVVLWGSSGDLSTEEKCKIMADYAKNRVGPIAKKYISK